MDPRPSAPDSPATRAGPADGAAVGEEDLDDLAGDGWAAWLAVAPGELVGLAVLLLGALVLTVVVVTGAGARPGADALPPMGWGGDDATLPAPGATGTPIDADGRGHGPAPGLTAAGGTSPHDPLAAEGHAPAEGSATPLNAPAAGGATAAPPSLAALVVHVTGGVHRPGLVTVAAGARVGDVVASAGGPTTDALMERLNLARPVDDGEHVHVPSTQDDETTLPPVGGSRTTASAALPDAAGGEGASSPLDINRASAAELESLPGIGPARAEAIVRYREEEGAFASPGDLRGVSGIGEATFQRLAPLVTVG